jgi:heme oxygenase (biliverdin-producing, ferredoxin)
VAIALNAHDRVVISSAFERALDRHASHPVLEPTYNPLLLSRSAALEADISYLLSVPTNKWKSHASYKALQSDKPPALKRYVDRIDTISNSSDPSPLLAHSYVRYLGDLSGGQSIKRALSKAYNLKDGQGGLEFFKFREMGSGKAGKEASIGELKKIKEWFRAGMDKGAGDDIKVKCTSSLIQYLLFLS